MQLKNLPICGPIFGPNFGPKFGPNLGSALAPPPLFPYRVPNWTPKLVPKIGPQNGSKLAPKIWPQIPFKNQGCQAHQSKKSQHSTQQVFFCGFFETFGGLLAHVPSPDVEKTAMRRVNEHTTRLLKNANGAM